MESSIFKKAAKFLKERKNNHRWMAIFLMLAAVAALGTVGILTLTGHAQTYKTRVLTCNAKEHTHTDNCYSEDGKLTCTEPEVILHTHNDDCYDENGELVCTLPEKKEHIHDDSCYETIRTLTCTAEETEGHEHTDDCYSVESELTCGLEETEGHTHDETCFDEEGNLICELEETEGHTHDETCYTEERILTCGLEEGEGHEHGDECYTEERELICGESEIEEHEHTDDCYKEETVETVDENGETVTETHYTLTCGKPTAVTHTHGDECFTEEELTDAEVEALAQEEAEPSEEPQPAEDSKYICGKEEHTHSADCVDETGSKVICGKEEHTHTEECLPKEARTPVFTFICGKQAHTHTDACMDEAGNPICGKEEHIHSRDCMELEFTCGKEEHTHSADCGDESAGELTCGKEAHVHNLDCLGIAREDLIFCCGKEEHTHDETCFDESGNLICGKEEHTHDFPCLAKEDTVLTASGDDYTITVTVPAAAIPELQGELSLNVRKLDPESDEYKSAVAVMEEQGMGKDGHRLFDITLLDGETEIEPLAPVTVSFTGTKPAEDGKDESEVTSSNVYHVDVDNNKVEDMKASVDENGKVTMETPHFSYYDYPVSTIAATFTETNGTITLTQDMVIGSSIYVSGNLTIDLNGNILTGCNNAFRVGSGDVLIIKDSKNKIPTETLDSEKNGLTKKAVFSNDQLTYFVTKAVPTGTGTNDLTYKNTVNFNGSGAFVGSAGALIRNEGGTVNIQSGRISRTGNGCAITMVTAGSNLNISGGYICGCNNNDNGGAIYATNGTINMTGGVIAANTAKRGGGIYSAGAAVKVSGSAVISGNDANGVDNTKRNPATGGEGLSHSVTGAWGGGGVYIDKAKITVSGGWITNNVASGNRKADAAVNLEYGCTTQGGGGVLADGSSTVQVTGEAQITGNYAENACGGVFIRYGGSGDGTVFTMDSVKSCISSNISNYREGGGIFLDRAQHASITAGRITNNKSYTPNDWGGGGIFISGLSSIEMKNTLVKDNSANGYGGGVGGCPTGRLFLQDSEGVAVYGNHAQGANLTHSPKSEDHVAANSPAFRNGGYQDVFSALAARAYLKMLGGGDANWSGTVDFRDVNDVDTHNEIYYQSGSVLGLTAHPNGDAISAAEYSATVFVTGNFSNTHGGGLMCNGIISFGTLTEKTMAAPVDIKINKSFVDKNGKEVKLTEGQFHFVLREGSVNGKIIAEGYNNIDGSIGGLSLQAPTDSKIKYENTDYTYGPYYLVEVKSDSNGVITYDNYYFKIMLYARMEKSVGAGNISLKAYRWFRAKVYYGSKSSDEKQIVNYDGNSTTGTKGSSFSPGGSTGHGTLILAKPDATKGFKNTVTEKPAYLHLVKEKNDGETNEDGSEKLDPMANVHFYLRDATSPDVLKNLGHEGSKLQDGFSRSDGRIDFNLQRGHTYYLREMVTDGVNDNYVINGPWIIEVENEETSDTGKLHIWKADDKGGSSDNNWEKVGAELTDVWQERDLPTGGTVSGGATTMKVQCLIIVNELKRDEYQLPETGGDGSFKYIMSSILLASAAVTLIYIEHLRVERRRRRVRTSRKR